MIWCESFRVYILAIHVQSLYIFFGQNINIQGGVEHRFRSITFQSTVVHKFPENPSWGIGRYNHT